MLSFLKNIRQKRKAKKADFPFFIEGFWPPYYLNFGGEAPHNAKVLTKMYEAKIGDIVPVFQHNGVTHRYVVDRITQAGGSDHIVSPLKFDLMYHSREGSSDVTH